VVVTKQVFVPPPAELLEPCASPIGDTTIGAQLTRLSWLVTCERSSKDAIKAWALSVKQPGT
jgi:hypothetical protein